MIITLLTDFGTRDYYIGAMKGAILRVNPQARIVDITHDIAPQDVRGAAFTLLNYYREFPPRAVHVCVVDPGVGSDRRAIVVETSDFYFVAPDNGVLSFALAAEEKFRAFELTDEKFFAPTVSRTFHGRDIFAPVAAHLSNGIPPAAFGRETADLTRFEIPAPRAAASADVIEAEIIHVDRFGNLVTNLKAADAPEKFRLEVNGRRVEKHLKFYAEAESEDEIFSIWGSAGFLEISAFRASAQNLLGAETGEKVYLSSARD